MKRNALIWGLAQGFWQPSPIFISDLLKAASSSSNETDANHQLDLVFFPGENAYPLRTLEIMGICISFRQVSHSTQNQHFQWEIDDGTGSIFCHQWKPSTGGLKFVDNDASIVENVGALVRVRGRLSRFRGELQLNPVYQLDILEYPLQKQKKSKITATSIDWESYHIARCLHYLKHVYNKPIELPARYQQEQTNEAGMEELDEDEFMVMPDLDSAVCLSELIGNQSVFGMIRFILDPQELLSNGNACTDSDDENAEDEDETIRLQNIMMEDAQDQLRQSLDLDLSAFSVLLWHCVLCHPANSPVWDEAMLREFIELRWSSYDVPKRIRQNKQVEVMMEQLMQHVPRILRLLEKHGYLQPLSGDSTLGCQFQVTSTESVGFIVLDTLRTMMNAAQQSMDSASADAAFLAGVTESMIYQAAKCWKLNATNKSPMDMELDDIHAFLETVKADQIPFSRYRSVLKRLCADSMLIETGYRKYRLV